MDKPDKAKRRVRAALIGAAIGVMTVPLVMTLTPWRGAWFLWPLLAACIGAAGSDSTDDIDGPGGPNGGCPGGAAA